MHRLAQSVALVLTCSLILTACSDDSANNGGGGSNDDKHYGAGTSGGDQFLVELPLSPTSFSTPVLISLGPKTV